MFEFYFQSGEFVGDSNGFWTDFGKDLIIQAVGALIAAYAAVKLYYKQRKEQLNAVAQERQDRNIDNVVFLDHLVSGSMECVCSQIIMYREFAESIKKSALGLPELDIKRTTVSLNRLVHKADLKELFSSYREINRLAKFDPDPYSFQTGIAIFEFLLGKIENDIDTVTRTSNQCSEAIKRVASSIQAIFTESASYYVEFPTDELASSIDALKSRLNNVLSDDLTIHQKYTRKFIEDVLSMLTASRKSVLTPSLWKVTQEAAEATSAYNELDFRLEAMYKLATTNERIFTEECLRLKSLFGPLHQFVSRLPDNSSAEKPESNFWRNLRLW